MDAQDGAGPAAPPLGARGRMLMKTLWDHRRRWIQAGNTGLSLANKLSNMMLAREMLSKERNLGVLARLPGILPKLGDRSFQQIAGMYPQLEQVVVELASVLARMEALHKNIMALEGRYDPEPTSPGKGRTTVVPPRIAVSKVVEISAKLLQMHRHEFAVRSAVTRHLLDEPAVRSQHLLYLAAWAHEPYISGEGDYLLDVVKLASAP